ncbi:MAG: tetratricopeptide repeat protein, partial [Actinomycetota bacterium]
MPVVREGSMIDMSARSVMTALYTRLLEAGLWQHIRSVGGSWTRGAGGAHFSTHDNNAFLDDLVATGSFCKDTRAGGILHPGTVSVREVARGAGLHLSLGPDNRIFAHVDGHSPVVGTRAGGLCRYERSSTLTHFAHEVLPLMLHPLRGGGQNHLKGDLKRELRTARGAWEQAKASGRLEEAAGAAVRLASLLTETGNPGLAEAVFREVTGWALPGHSAIAAFNLGALLERNGEHEQARDAFADAAAGADDDLLPWAMSGLAGVLEKLGDPTGAVDAYRRAIGTGHPENAPWAALELGNLLEDLDRPEEAKDAYRQAIDSGHPEFAPWAALSLARMQHRLGGEEAADAYALAIGMGHPDVTPWAELRLGQHLRETGVFGEAAAAFRRGA